MNSELIIISEYCVQSHIEPDFILQLEDEGLIEIAIINNERYIHISQLRSLEQYARWYYDLSINIAGIDVIRNLMSRIDLLQEEILQLREQSKFFDNENEF